MKLQFVSSYSAVKAYFSADVTDYWVTNCNTQIKYKKP